MARTTKFYVKCGCPTDHLYLFGLGRVVHCKTKIENCQKVPQIGLHKKQLKKNLKFGGVDKKDDSKPRDRQKVERTKFERGQLFGRARRNSDPLRITSLRKFRELRGFLHLLKTFGLLGEQIFSKGRYGVRIHIPIRVLG